MIMLEDTTPIWKAEVILLVAALGVGTVIQPPLIAIQAAMPIKQMAVSTSTFMLIRTLGATIGISIGDTIYASELQRRLPLIQGYSPPGGSYSVTNNVAGLSHIEPLAVRNQVLHAYTESLATIWVVCTPMVFLGFVCTLCIRSYSLKRTLIQTPRKGDVTPTTPTDPNGNPTSVTASIIEKESFTPLASPLDEKREESGPGALEGLATLPSSEPVP